MSRHGFQNYLRFVTDSLEYASRALDSHRLAAFLPAFLSRLFLSRSVFTPLTGRLLVGLHHRIRLAVILFGCLFFVACGGGSGNGNGNTPPPQDDPDAGSGTATISGTIQVASNSVVDSDTNDSNQMAVSNNGLSLAQPLPNPVAVGGYVTFPSSGGNLCDTSSNGDFGDFFAAELFADQVIELIIADQDTADLDLYLATTDGQVVDGSISPASNESVQVPADDDYIVVVCAFAGASNYTLAIGQGGQSFAANSPSSHSVGYNTYNLSSPIVPGDVVVQWQQDVVVQWQQDVVVQWQQDLKKHGNVNPAYTTQALPPNMQVASTDTFNVSLVQMEAVTLQNMTQKRLQHSHAQAGANMAHATSQLTFSDPLLAERLATLQAIKGLQARPDVAFAEPNFWRKPLLTPNDPGYAFQWHYPLIDLPDAWDTTTGDSNVIVAVIDTGVLLNHPDMQGQFDPQDPNGVDFIRDPSVANDGNGVDGDANDVGDNPRRGSSFHGTHVAGTIAAATNNGTGVAGVAWDAKIMPLRALGEGGGTSLDIRNAVLYAAGLNNTAAAPPNQQADIINLSLGGPGGSQTEQNAYTAARNAGVIIIAAAGNDGNSQSNFPAAYEGVVSVSAVTQEKRLARYSNFGSSIDVAAPGGDTSEDVDGDGYADGVLSAGGNDTSGNTDFVYPFFQGTSMAAPHVAGVAALMHAVRPGLTPDEFDQLLASGMITEDLGAVGRDDLFGHGLINARLAIEQAQALNGGMTAPAAGRLQVNPRSLGFGAFVDDLELNANNSGDSRLTLVSVTDDASWLTVTPTETDSSTGLGRYTATVERAGLADGAYEAVITFSSSENTVEVPVIMQVGDAFTADLGVQYVLLIDAVTQQVVAQDQVTVGQASGNEGEYEYQFTSVAAGDYLIVVGSDYDDDLVICDRGEACGAFLTLDDPAIVTVPDGASINGIDFTSGYEAAFNAASQSATKPTTVEFLRE